MGQQQLGTHAPQWQSSAVDGIQLAVALLPQTEVPRFSGDPAAYQAFKRAFEVRMSRHCRDDRDKVDFLLQCLSGEPRELVDDKWGLQLGYDEAMARLDREYGEMETVVVQYDGKLNNWKVLDMEDAAGLRALSLFLNKCVSGMRASAELTAALEHISAMQAVLGKLPAHLRNRWSDLVAAAKHRDDRRSLKFADLARFVEKASRAANDPQYGALLWPPRVRRPEEW